MPPRRVGLLEGDLPQGAPEQECSPEKRWRQSPKRARTRVDAARVGRDPAADGALGSNIDKKQGA